MIWQDSRQWSTYWRWNTYGRRVSDADAPLGVAFVVSTYGEFPAVAYNSTDNEYLLALTRHDSYMGNLDIYGLRLSSTGATLDYLRVAAASGDQELLLVFFPIAYLLLIGSASLRWDRWAIPLLPFTTVLAGGATMRLVDKIATFGGMRKRFDMVLVVVVLLVSVGPAYEIVSYDYRISQEDTRTLSKTWVESHIAPGTKMGQDCYSGPIWTELFDVTKVFSLSDWPLEYYRNEGFEYLLVSSYMYDRYFAEAQEYPKNVEFYGRLFKEGELVQEFKPNPKNRPGPTIRVYRIR